MGVINDVHEDLEAVSKAIVSNDEAREFMRNPEVTRENKATLLERVFGERVHPLTMQFLKLLLGKRREDLFELVRHQYADLKRRHDKVVHVRVCSARPLDEDQRRRLLSKVGEQLGRKVEPEFDLEPSLIGGIRVSYGDYVLDGSIRGSLDRIREKIRRSVLKQA